MGYSLENTQTVGLHETSYLVQTSFLTRLRKGDIFNVNATVLAQPFAPVIMTHGHIAYFLSLSLLIIKIDNPKCVSQFFLEFILYIYPVHYLACFG